MAEIYGRKVRHDLRTGTPHPPLPARAPTAASGTSQPCAESREIDPLRGAHRRPHLLVRRLHQRHLDLRRQRLHRGAARGHQGVRHRAGARRLRPRRGRRPRRGQSSPSASPARASPASGCSSPAAWTPTTTRSRSRPPAQSLGVLLRAAEYMAGPLTTLVPAPAQPAPETHPRPPCAPSQRRSLSKRASTPGAEPPQPSLPSRRHADPGSARPAARAAFFLSRCPAPSEPPPLPSFPPATSHQQPATTEPPPPSSPLARATGRRPGRGARPRGGASRSATGAGGSAAWPETSATSSSGSTSSSPAATDAFHVDTFDLYSARQRGALRQAGRRGAGGQAATSVKQDLGRVLLEARGAAGGADPQGRSSPRRPGGQLSAEERAEALELLEDPELLDRILGRLRDAAAWSARRPTSWWATWPRCPASSTSRWRCSCSQLVRGRQVGADGRGARLRARGGAGAVLGHDRAVALLHGRDRPQAQDPGHRRGGGRGAGELRPEAPAVRGRADHRLHRQGPGHRPPGDPRVPGRGAGGDLAHHHRRRRRRGAPEPLPGADRGRGAASRPGPSTGCSASASTLDGLLAQARPRPSCSTLHRNAQRLLEPLARRQPLRPPPDLPRRHDQDPARPPEVPHPDRRRGPAPPAPAAGAAPAATTAGGSSTSRSTPRRHRVANRLAAEVLGRTLDELPPQTRRFLDLLARDGRRSAARRWSIEPQRAPLHPARGARAHRLELPPGARSTSSRLVELEYVLVHRGGRGQSFVYELLWRRRGQGRRALRDRPGRRRAACGTRATTA